MKNRRFNHSGRIISLLLVICMTVAFMATAVFAGVIDSGTGETASKTTYYIHVTYSETNETVDLEGNESFDSAFEEAKAWVRSKGGKPETLTLDSSQVTFVGVEYEGGSVIIGGDGNIVSGKTIYLYKEDRYYTASKKASEGERNILPSFDAEQKVTCGSGAFEDVHFVELVGEDLVSVTGTVTYKVNEESAALNAAGLKAFLSEQPAGAVITASYSFVGSGDYSDFTDEGTLKFTIVSGVDEVIITIDKPETGKTLADSAAVTASAAGVAVDSECIKITAIGWSKNGEAAGEVALAETVYEANISVETDRGVYFDPDKANITVKVNGVEIETGFKSLSEVNGRLVLNVLCKFDATEASTDPEYQIIEGADSIFTKGSGESLKVRADGEFSKFTGVKVDDEIIDPENYTAVSGSTIVTLKSEYLETLSVGKHTLTVLYIDGECSTDFEIKEVSEPQKPGNPDKPADPEKPERPETPQTGDNSMMLMWAALMTIMGCVLSGIAIFGKKKA